jgi:hypothetical protein
MSIITEEKGYYFPNKVGNGFKGVRVIEENNQDTQFNRSMKSSNHQDSKIDWDITNSSNKKEMGLMDFARIFLRKKKISNKPQTTNENNKNSENKKQPNLKSQLHSSNDMSEDDDDYELIELIPTETKSQMSSKYQIPTSLKEDEDNRMKDDDEKEKEKEKEKEMEKKRKWEKKETEMEKKERQEIQDKIFIDYEEKKDKDFYEQMSQSILKKSEMDVIEEKERQRRRMDRDKLEKANEKKRIKERKDKERIDEMEYQENLRKRSNIERSERSQRRDRIKTFEKKDEEINQNLLQFSKEAKDNEEKSKKYQTERIKLGRPNSNFMMLNEDYLGMITQYFSSQKDFTNLESVNSDTYNILESKFGIKNFVIYLKPEYVDQLIESRKNYNNVRNLHVDIWRREYTEIFPRLERLTIVDSIDDRMRTNMSTKAKIKLFPESITYLELMNNEEYYLDENEEYNNFPSKIISLKFNIMTSNVANFISNKIYNSTTIKNIDIMIVNISYDSDCSFLTGFFNLGSENSKLESIKIAVDRMSAPPEKLIGVISEPITSSRSNLKKLTLENVRVSIDEPISMIFFDSFNNRNCKITNLEMLDVGQVPENVIKRISNSICGINCKLISIKFTEGYFPFGFGILANSLKHPNCKITSIDLDLCRINQHDFISITEVIKDENCKLTSLMLRSNEIRDDRLTKLFESIAHENCKLVYLDLYNTGLYRINELIDSLKNKNCKLTFINLGANDIFEYDIITLAKALRDKNCKLTSICLSRLNIVNNELTEIIQSLEDEDCILTNIDLSFSGFNISNDIKMNLLKSLRNKNCKLTSVNLNKFYINNFNIGELCDSLEDDNCKLTSIYLRYNVISDIGAYSLAESFKNKNCKLTKVDLRNNLISKYGKMAIISAVNDPHCKIKLSNLEL